MRVARQLISLFCELCRSVCVGMSVVPSVSMSVVPSKAPCFALPNSWCPHASSAARKHSWVERSGKGSVRDEYKFETRIMHAGREPHEWTTDPLGRSSPTLPQRPGITRIIIIHFSKHLHVGNHYRTQSLVHTLPPYAPFSHFPPGPPRTRLRAPLAFSNRLNRFSSNPLDLLFLPGQAGPGRTSV